MPVEITVAPPPEPAPAPKLAGDFFFVTEHGVVLDLDAPTHWGAGPVRGDGNDEDDLWGQVTAYRDADLDALPEGVVGTLASELDLYDAGGRICRVRLGKARLVAQLSSMSPELIFEEDSPEGLYEYWEIEDGQKDPKHTRKLARSIRRKVLETQPRWLVASWEALEGDCGDAVWARDASLPAPEVFTKVEHPWGDRKARRARKALMGSDRVREMHAMYDEWRGDLDPEYAGEIPSWETFADDTLSVVAWHDRSGETQVVSAQVGDFVSTCGDGFGDHESWIYAFPGARPQPIRQGNTPLAVLDLDHDGHFEFLWQTHEGLFFEAQDESEQKEAAVYFIGCPC
jgi:hypothetical protein